MGKSPEFEYFLTNKDKALFLERAAAKATDEKPLWIDLRNPESLQWDGMGELIPQRGTFVRTVREKDKRGIIIHQAVVVDFTRIALFCGKIPYAKFPLAAVEINRQENRVWIDCKKAVEAGTMPHFNFFTERP